MTDYEMLVSELVDDLLGRGYAGGASSGHSGREHGRSSVVGQRPGTRASGPDPRDFRDTVIDN